MWDYNTSNMEYLLIPENRPAYRGDRDHKDFITKLSKIYEGEGEEVFFDALIDSMRGVERVHDTLDEGEGVVYSLVDENVDEVFATIEESWEGGWSTWLQGGGKNSRTRHI